ncbi:MAG: biotin/lipoyl-binding protein [Gemmataceae bacterium]
MRPLLAMLAVSLTLAGCGPRVVSHPTPAGAGEAPQVVCLGYADVEGGLIEPRPDRPGRVVQVLVEEGATVPAGQPLLALDDTDARQEVARARAGVRAAEGRESLARQEARQHPERLKQLVSTLEATSSRLASARITLRRQEDLFSRNLVSKGDVDVAQEQVRELEASVEAARARLAEIRAIDPQVGVQVAAAEVEAARARLGQAQYTLDTCILKAPTAGVIVTLSARVGEVVGSPAAPAPVVLLPNRSFVVRAEIEQELVARVAPAMFAQVRDEMSGEGPWKGSVVRLGRLYVRRQHRTDPTQLVDVPTVECLVRLEPGHPPLRIGQRLRVSIYREAPTPE